jgi:hypothetical protein
MDIHGISFAGYTWYILGYLLIFLAFWLGNQIYRPARAAGHLVVELWTASASRGRLLCGQNWEDPKEVSVWCCQTSVGNKAGLRWPVTFYWYIHGIYNVYTQHSRLWVSYLLRKFELLSCYVMLRAWISSSSNFHGFPVGVPKLKITETSKLGLPSWFINQPDGSGPEGPLPHLEGAAGRYRTHVTPDEGYMYCTYNAYTEYMSGIYREITLCYFHW